MKTKEIWKDIPNYEGLYQVSNLGRVKGLSRVVECKNGVGRRVNEKIIKRVEDAHGYLALSLSKNSKKKTFKVHVLVAVCFLNHKQGGRKIVVDHINNIKTDNRIDNLQLITARLNSSKDRTGVSQYTGVSWCKRNKKWLAQIWIGKKHKNLGYFHNELEAAKKYNEQLNIIENGKI